MVETLLNVIPAQTTTTMNDAISELEHQLSACKAERTLALRLLGNLRLGYLKAGEGERARLQIEIEDTDARVRELERQCGEIEDEITSAIQNRAETKTSSGNEAPEEPTPSDAYPYDAYLSYAAAEPDLSWLWEELVPRLDEAGLRYVLAGDVAPPGVPRVLGVEQAMLNSRRTIVLLTPAYMASKSVQFDAILAQVESWNQGLFRLLPILRENVDAENPPAWLPARLNPNFVRPIDLSPAALARGQRIPRLDPWARLIEALRSPLPAL